MKKIKLLSFATMVALMTLGLASCEKENFSMNIEIPQASPAVVSISPNVIALIDGSAENVTNSATITYDNMPAADKDGKIAATTVTINVSYTATILVDGESLSKTLTATEIVNIPALDKGMSCTLTPTIYLSVQTKTNLNAIEGTVTTLNPEVQDVTIKNYTQYFYTDVNGEYQYKAGTEVDRNSINWLDASFKFNADINSMINAYDQIKMETKPVENITVYAQSQTIIKATTQVVSTKYIIKKKVTLVRGEETEVDIVEFEVKEYQNTTDNQGAGPKTETNPTGYDVNINLNGISHGHGHGHGDGHGNSANAGGGIVWGE